MRIDSYKFGQVVIDGQSYDNDVIVCPDQAINWWRREAHQVYPEDLEEAVGEKPEVLIIGTGDSGLVKVLPETREYLASQNIELIVEPTKKACQIYNQLFQKKRVVAALHLTC